MLRTALIVTSMVALIAPVYADSVPLMVKQSDQSTTFKVAQNSKAKKFQRLKTKDARPLEKGQALEKGKIVPGLEFKFANGMKSKLEAMQWTMVAGSKGRPILSGNQYRLTNSISGRGLKRQKRTIAANLGWLSSNSKAFTVRIKRKSGNGQVRYGDVVALELASYGWLRFKEQSKGINISDDNRNPHYSWIVQGGTKGTKLVSDMPFALYFDKSTEWSIANEHGALTLVGTAKANVVAGRPICQTGYSAKMAFTPETVLPGKAFVKLRDHLCEEAVAATGAAIVASTGASAAPVVAAGAPYAIRECKKL